jgi:branched-subunit amino acid ABC-type transport system permease component
LRPGLVVGSLYALCALGWGLIYGTTLHFHVAHGAVFSLAAYFAYVGQKLLHLPLFVAVLAAILASALCGLLIDLLMYQQLERRGAYRTSLFIASLGCSSSWRTFSRSCSRPTRCAWTSACSTLRSPSGRCFSRICMCSPWRSRSWDTRAHVVPAALAVGSGDPSPCRARPKWRAPSASI